MRRAMLVVIPQALVDSSNEVLEYVHMFTRIVVECQRAGPSAVTLDQVGYIAEWPYDQRLRFIRGYAEALSTMCPMTIRLRSQRMWSTWRMPTTRFPQRSIQ